MSCRLIAATMGNVWELKVVKKTLGKFPLSPICYVIGTLHFVAEGCDVMSLMSQNKKGPLLSKCCIEPKKFAVEAAT